MCLTAGLWSYQALPLHTLESILTVSVLMSLLKRLVETVCNRNYHYILTRSEPEFFLSGMTKPHDTEI
jgi:hypothetical protein